MELELRINGEIVNLEDVERVSNEYFAGEKVRCTCVTEENHEGLVLNEIYTIVSRTFVNGDWIYGVRNSKNELTHTIDRFERVLLNAPKIPRLNKGGVVESLPNKVGDIKSLGSYLPTGTYGMSKSTDMVNHPPHYNQFRFEVIDVIEDVTKDLKGIEAVTIANVLKYVMRFQFKNGLEDLKKARFYLDKCIKSKEEQASLEIPMITTKQIRFIASLTTEIKLDRYNLPEYISPVKNYKELSEVEASQVIDKLLAIKNYNKMADGYTE